MIDGTGIFAGVDGAGLQQSLEASASRLPVPGGEYTHPSELMHVTWANGWKENSRDEKGVEVTNADGSISLAIELVATDGLAWSEVATRHADWIYDDQGDDAELWGPHMTDNTFWLATDGQYGIRLLEGVLLPDSAEVYTSAFAHTIEVKGDDAKLLFRDAAESVKINGEPAFRHIEDVDASYTV